MLSTVVRYRRPEKALLSTEMRYRRPEKALLSTEMLLVAVEMVSVLDARCGSSAVISTAR